MAWFGSGSESVPELIAKKKYDKAVALLEEQLGQEAGKPRVRRKLAGVLVMAGRHLAALKKIERLAPGRRDVATKLASLIRGKTVTKAAPAFFEPAGSTFDASHFEKQAEPVVTDAARTATVTAATQCELLELNKNTLDEITQKQPNVRQVLEDFYIQRASA